VAVRVAGRNDSVNSYYYIDNAISEDFYIVRKSRGEDGVELIPDLGQVTEIRYPVFHVGSGGGTDVPLPLPR
jgi:hypothetical protein